MLGAKAVIFHDRFKEKENGRHYLTDMSEECGAEIILCETHEEATRKCTEHCEGKKGYLH